MTRLKVSLKLATPLIPSLTLYQLSYCDSRAGLEYSTGLLYLRVPQAAGQVKILIFLVFSIYANNFCDAGQVTILRYFDA